MGRHRKARGVGLNINIYSIKKIIFNAFTLLFDTFQSPSEPQHYLPNILGINKNHYFAKLKNLNMKKITILFLLFSLITFKVFSQCNVKEYKIKGISSFENDFEGIYQTSAQETFQIFVIKVIKMRELDDPKSAYQYVLAIKSGTDNPSKMLIPRGLYIKFDDNTYLDLDSETIMDAEVNDMLMFKTCLYNLKEEEVLKLQNKTIKFINIIDTRTEKYVKSLPYGDLIKEQFKCLN